MMTTRTCRVQPPKPQQREIVLSIHDQSKVRTLSTASVFRGSINVERMEAALAVALSHAPVFGGSLTQMAACDPIRLVTHPVLRATCQDFDSLCSNWVVAFEPSTGAQVRSKTLAADLETRLLDAGDELWRSMALLSASEREALVDHVGPPQTLMHTGKPLSTILISQGAEVSVLGVSITHIISDGRCYFAFFRLLCRLYSGEAPPHDYRIAHLDNAVAKEWLPSARLPSYRSSLSPCSIMTLSMYVAAADVHIQKNEFLTGAPKPACRIFNIRLTSADQAKLKAHVASKRPEEASPRSTYDALVELFAPPATYAPYHFVQAIDLRGRSRLMPPFEHMPTSGNADTTVWLVVLGEMTHAAARRVLTQTRLQSLRARLSCAAAMADRTWGANSWVSISRDFMPKLAGLELLLLQPLQKNRAPDVWTAPPAQKLFLWETDATGTRALRLCPVNSEHAERVRATLDALGLPYVATDQEGDVRASSSKADSGKQLYASAMERRQHDANGTSCGDGGCGGPCLTAHYVSIRLCVDCSKCVLSGLLCAGHLTPCYPFDTCCGIVVGSMPDDHAPGTRCCLARSRVEPEAKDDETSCSCMSRTPYTSTSKGPSVQTMDRGDSNLPTVPSRALSPLPVPPAGPRWEQSSSPCEV